MSRPFRMFLFDLAVSLHMDVREIERWPSSLLSEWLAYFQLKPRHDFNWMFGMLASVMVNLWSKSRTKPEDFIPVVKRKRQTPDEMMARLKSFAAFANARNNIKG